MRVEKLFSGAISVKAEPSDVSLLFADKPTFIKKPSIGFNKQALTHTEYEDVVKKIEEIATQVHLKKT